MKGGRRKNFRLLLTGGGTGGHLFPAVATAQSMKKRLPEARIMFVGTRRRLDREHLGSEGFELRTVHSYGLKGKKLPALLKALAVLPVTVCEAGYQILRFRPDVVCGVGGYVTGPVVAAARMLGVPAIIHEQNSVPGLANRKLGTIASRICISLPDSGAWFPAEKTVYTGNPVRSAILECARLPEEERPSGTKQVLILGGSQGAHAVNEAVVKMCGSRDCRWSRIRFIHQTGAEDEQWVREAYRGAGIDAEVSAFIRDMASVYRRADLVISRAGATTLAELAVMGKPAILIPYPHAADNHQEKNALNYVRGGGAVLLTQQEASPEKLGDILAGLLDSPDELSIMARAMKEMGVEDAAERIVDICLELAG